jgi:cytochrome P450
MTTLPGGLLPGRRAGWRDRARIQSDPIGYLEELQADYGSVCLVRLVGRLAVYVITLAHVLLAKEQAYSKGRPAQRLKPFLGEGLYTSEGVAHQVHRRQIQPAFHQQRLANYSASMTTFTRDCLRQWVDGKPFDIGQDMSRLTLRIAAKTLLDADIEHQEATIRTDILALLDIYNRVTGNPFAEVLLALPLPATLRFRRTRQRLDALLSTIMDERAGQDDRGDLLSWLLAVRDEAGQAMSRQQIRDEAMTLFLAGAETMAIALSWACYLLSHHPTVVRRMRDEITQVLGDRAPTIADVPRLTYVDQVVSETLRLYPPAYAIARRALASQSIGEYVVPAGASIVTSAYIVQHDPRWWPDPLRFDPDRFAPGQREAAPRFTYFPFGGGAHHCIAEPFARLEGVLVLTTIVQHWDLEPATQDPVTPGRFVTLRPDRPIQVRAMRPAGISAASDIR